MPDGGNHVEGGFAEEAGGQHLLSHYHELAELAGSLAHEIKNPLSVIRMNMDLLAEDLADAETPRERRAGQDRDRPRSVYASGEPAQRLPQVRPGPIARPRTRQLE